MNNPKLFVTLRHRFLEETENTDEIENISEEDVEDCENNEEPE